jgi:hypothetical protein
MISSVGSQVQAYTATKLASNQNNQTTNGSRIDPNIKEYKATDYSTTRSLRDGMVSLINKVSGNDEDAEKLLSDYSRTDSGGLMSTGLFDLKNPDAVRRYQRISQQFEVESKMVEKQKTALITEGRSSGKKAQEILNDIIALYDSQSDLYKTGRGWEGNVFAFDPSSPAGFARTMSYTSDTIDTRA